MRTTTVYELSFQREKTPGSQGQGVPALCAEEALRWLPGGARSLPTSWRDYRPPSGADALQPPLPVRLGAALTNARPLRYQA